jgi:SAM-dependent methyltransferase
MEKMNLTPPQWHLRFQQQSRWTEEARCHLYQSLSVYNNKHILEVGSGTGVITTDLHQQTQAVVHGVDIDLNFTRLARQNDPQTRFTCGDAFSLPYASRSFDVTICHFLLLWLSEPELALCEMARVTRSDGYLIVLAEPDYSSRIDYPRPLAEIGRLQASALRAQGANPQTGRRLASFCIEARLENVRCGLVGGEWGSRPESGFLESEWDIIRADLAGQFTREEMDIYQKMDEAAWKSGFRILFVPTFYAWGRVP